jgi:hypothetical protein
MIYVRARTFIDRCRKLNMRVRERGDLGERYRGTRETFSSLSAFRKNREEEEEAEESRSAEIISNLILYRPSRE